MMRPLKAFDEASQGGRPSPQKSEPTLIRVPLRQLVHETKHAFYHHHPKHKKLPSVSVTDENTVVVELLRTHSTEDSFQNLDSLDL
jgi:hypothetical protein